MSSTTSRFIFSASAALAVMFLAVPSSHAAIVFRDTFNRANNAAFGSNSGPEGSGTWSKAVVAAAAPTGNPGSFEINTNQALATHNADDAVYQITVPTAGFASPWPVSNKYTDAAGKISWYINMQSTLTTPNGIGANAGGMGFVLGATNINSGAVGNNGYLLYIGNPGTPDPIHLASFTGVGVGMPATLGEVLTSWMSPFDNVGASTDYFSFRVEFTPSSNLWEVFARSDGASAFADPTVNTGYTSVGSGVNSTYTSTALPFVGITGSWRTAGLLSRYDNVVIGVVPEPSSIALAGCGFLALFGIGRRCNIR